MGLYGRLKSSGVLRFTHPYYILNVMTIATYWFARDIALKKGGIHTVVMENMLEWEKRSFSSLAVLLAIKMVRSMTVDGMLADGFMYTKATILLLSLFIDWRLFTWYYILISVLFLMVPQPMYEGPEDIVYLTPATYDDHVKDGKGCEKDTKWLVEFYASWSPPCVHIEPIFAQLSVKYSSSQFQFAKMDLGRWPRIAKEFNISTSGMSKQLPTLIAFENGKEIGRIPHVFPDGSVARGRYRRADLIKAFDMENGMAALTEAALRKEKKEATKKENGKKNSKKIKVECYAVHLSLSVWWCIYMNALKNVSEPSSKAY